MSDYKKQIDYLLSPPAVVPPRKKSGHPSQEAAYEPTPEEIREHCLRIQEDWTPEERRRRADQKSVREYERGIESNKTYRIAK